MKVLDGDSLLDGGTTSIKFELDSQIQSLTILFSLPNDQKDRFIYKGIELFDYSRKIEIDSIEERELLSSLQTLCGLKYGKEYLHAFLNGEESNKGENAWFFVFHFIKLAYQEREYLRDESSSKLY